MRRTAIAIALLLITPALASAQNKRAPRDLNAYSLQFWPKNALLRGQRVQTRTPYGILSCRSVGHSARRVCQLD
jgi:hypothetical protein